MAKQKFPIQGGRQKWSDDAMFYVVCTKLPMSALPCVGSNLFFNCSCLSQEKKF